MSQKYTQTIKTLCAGVYLFALGIARGLKGSSVGLNALGIDSLIGQWRIPGVWEAIGCLGVPIAGTSVDMHRRALKITGK